MVIEYFSKFIKFSKEQRKTLFKRYPEKAKRINKDIVEIIVIGDKNKPKWISITYCVKDRFTFEEIESLKDEIRAKT